MARTFPALANKTWTAGLKEFGPVPLEVGEEWSWIRLDKLDFANPEATVEIGADLSLDGGATWVRWYRQRMIGGPNVDEAGGLVYESIRKRGMPEPSNPNRLIRGYLILSERTKLGLDVWVGSVEEAIADGRV